MRYASIMPNDFINGEGVSVSLWMQGCPFHCPGCHNPQTWNYDGGKFIQYEELIAKLDAAMKANGVKRNLSILGGEPLDTVNIFTTNMIVDWCKLNYPDAKIYIWTGYRMQQIAYWPIGQEILNKIDVLVDGRYVEEYRDISLPLCGSRNQRVLRKGIDF